MIDFGYLYTLNYHTQKTLVDKYLSDNYKYIPGQILDCKYNTIVNSKVNRFFIEDFLIVYGNGGIIEYVGISGEFLYDDGSIYKELSIDLYDPRITGLSDNLTCENYEKEKI